MPVSVPVSSTMMMFPHGQRSFNGSENDLHLNYNTIGGGQRPQVYSGGVRYSPDGGPRAMAGDTEAEIQMYKTRVIYHSGGQDQPDHEASV